MTDPAVPVHGTTTPCSDLVARLERAVEALEHPDCEKCRLPAEALRMSNELIDAEKERAALVRANDDLQAERDAARMALDTITSERDALAARLDRERKIHVEVAGAIARKDCTLCPYLGKGDPCVDWVAHERDVAKHERDELLGKLDAITAERDRYRRALEIACLDSSRKVGCVGCCGRDPSGCEHPPTPAGCVERIMAGALAAAALQE